MPNFFETSVLEAKDLFCFVSASNHFLYIKSASKSAASGGITSIICMPNTSPPIDQPAIIHSIQRRAREVALSKVFCTGCITRNFKKNNL